MNLKIKITIIAIAISLINYFAVVLGVYFLVPLLISALITYFILIYFINELSFRLSYNFVKDCSVRKKSKIFSYI